MSCKKTSKSFARRAKDKLVRRRRTRNRLGNLSKGRRSIKHGWIKDTPDPRDHKFAVRFAEKLSQRANFSYVPTDLSINMPAVKDQGNLGACTAFATTAMVSFVRDKNLQVKINPSPLFTYYATRVIENTVSTDAGATVRNAVKSTVVSGITANKACPYDVNKFALRPAGRAFRSAKKNQTIEYLRIDKGSISQMKQCLEDGFPFVFGIYLYESFFDTTVEATGVVPVPNTRREEFVGGHCMVCCGWKMIGDVVHFIVQNSWSTRWGDKGYCYIPQDVMANTNMVRDLWTIREVEGKPVVLSPTPTPTPVPSPTPTPTPTPTPP